MRLLSRISWSVPLCTAICTLDDFPGLTFNKVPLTSKPSGNCANSFGSNSTGVSLFTGPVVARQPTVIMLSLGITTSLLPVLTLQMASELEL